MPKYIIERNMPGAGNMTKDELAAISVRSCRALEEIGPEESIPPEQMDKYLAEMEERMREAARKFDFKQAAAYRDRLQELKSRVLIDTPSP